MWGVYSDIAEMRLVRGHGDDPVQDGQRVGDAVQIQPQSINIKIRPNTPETLTLTFRLAENYPVDLYYLMDLSNSMKDDKDNLASLGNKIAAEMSNITKNFRLGFGSFVDKVVMPYVSTVPSKLQEPCLGCEPPYSFKNQLRLDTNTDLFEEYVKKARVSGNLDAPEGGFDAIMQAVQCKDQIGWRSQSRKMLLFSTDAGFHFAGDGKLGGIVKPNDGDCHLDPAGRYSEAENQDYPSVSQISTKIRENSVNVIFAVTEDQLPVYNKLSQYIEGSEATKLAADSSNIVTVIKNNYQRITSKVEMNTQFAENITVKFKSSCKSGGEMQETKVCEGLSIGDSVTFEVSVMVTDCPTEPSKRSRTFSIYPIGLSESLDISLDLICECDCEKPEKEIANSDQCNKMGTFECGQCTCDKDRYGNKCECDGTQSTSEESLAKCRNPNSTSQVVCSGRGECVCGGCDCKPRRAHSTQKYSGMYCNCDDYACAMVLENVNVACASVTPLLTTRDQLTGKYGSDECKQKCQHVTLVDEIDEEEVKMCPESVNILAIVLGTIGGIVFAGLVFLVIWKIWTTIHDRREFAKFEKETQNAKWDTGENPIYQQATSTFKNPTYAGK
ncbi:ITBX-like protein [Mya arenaria]|uniref:Integrin beta n=1 Tax=Mya arenaria TaxID=6604 RepID=A0ABY7D9S7_MYAAR|nr:ITBX-like protein [Mya arenaria]